MAVVDFIKGIADRCLQTFKRIWQGIVRILCTVGFDCWQQVPDVGGGVSGFPVDVQAIGIGT